MKEVRKELMETLYKEMIEDPMINSSTQWRKILPTYKEMSRTFSSLQNDDRLKVFQDVIREHEKKDEEEKRKKREDINRQARKARAEFRIILTTKYDVDAFNVETRFKDFRPLIETEPVYIDLLSFPGSTPRDLFYDFIDDLELRLREQRKKIEEILKHQQETISKTSTFAEFRALLDRLRRFVDEIEQGEENDGKEEELSSIIDSLKLSELKKVFEDMKDKAERKEKHEQKRLQKQVESFKDLLKSSKVRVDATDTWDSVKSKLENHKDYKELEDENLKEKLFEEYVEKLKNKDSRKRDRSDDENFGDFKDAKRRKEE